MRTCEPDPITRLDLPRELADLDGLVLADLRAIVTNVSDRARDRLHLSPRQHRRLRVDLWNRLVGSLNEAVEPLTAEAR
jgi:hypothetical protein